MIANQLQEHVDSFMTSLKAQGYSPKTIKGNKCRLKQFCSFLKAKGVRRFQDVTQTIYERYSVRLRKRGLTWRTRQGYLSAVKRLFGYLNQGGQMFENPVEFVTMAGRPSVLPKVISENQVRKLLGAPDCTRTIGLRDRAILEMFYDTGMRLEELVGLEQLDVDLPNRTVRVFGKGSKERLLPLGEYASHYLHLYLERSRPKLIAPSRRRTEALWISNLRGPLSSRGVQESIMRHASKAGLDGQVSCHTLRRSCATHMLQHGAHPYAVAAMLGHSNLMTLSHYLKLSIADLQKEHRKCPPGQ